MKARPTNSTLGGMAVLATILTILFSWGVASTAEYHHANDCTVCHDMSGATANLALIAPSIDLNGLVSPKSGVKDVVFTCDFSIENPCDGSGTNSYADGTGLVDGICEVCHTTPTKYHINTGLGTPHYNGENCFQAECHATHCEEFKAPMPDDAVHNMHTAANPKMGGPLVCEDCHSSTEGKSKKYFRDDQLIADTTACDGCHSEGGGFNGSALAKTYFADGMYDIDGSLKDGKWCAACHDSDPANTEWDGSGNSAPDIGGDDTDYGFYQTGHGLDSGLKYLCMYFQEEACVGFNGNPGANQECDACHDSGTSHFSDGNTRLRTGFSMDQANSNCNNCHPPGPTPQGVSADADPKLYTAGAGSNEYEDPGTLPERPQHSGLLCSACHELHGAGMKVANPAPAMALDVSRALCLSCHDGDPGPVPPVSIVAHSDEDEECSTCHNPHIPAHGAGRDCQECHGHDAGYEYDTDKFSEGAGTSQSHSTHTEDDADDVKGPLLACGDCHNTDNYYYFNSGTGDPPYDLTATTVCDDCHSSTGVAMAKANWEVGGEGSDRLSSNIYESDGVTLKPGKEQWCATCHDDVPAYSQAAVVESPAPYIVDNLDPGFSYDPVDPDPPWYCKTKIDAYPSGGTGTFCFQLEGGDGSNKAIWRPNIAVDDAGDYRVYAWWKSSSLQANNARYTVYYGDPEVSIPFTVNQRTAGGQWNELTIESGALPFPNPEGIGIDYRVVLGNDADAGGRVVADAIRFEQQ